jgi:hypothetical protein
MIPAEAAVLLIMLSASLHILAVGAQVILEDLKNLLKKPLIEKLNKCCRCMSR